MSEIPKAYEPQSVEDKWYDFWQQHGCFTADPARVGEQRPAYSIVIPPPNVTGMLHMGHVLNNTIQDILSRKARMDGKEVLWLPGTDHAGIATQVQVEKALKKEEKKTKHDLGREEFLKRVWMWKEKHGGIIIQQLKKLGCSCDWTRERFTMDPEYSRCVQKVFVELYRKGLIYRGKRMVNWCPATQTALSDEEVEMKPQKGFMYHFRVEVVEKDAAIAKAAHPLTPALSPGERENSSPTFVKTATGDSSAASGVPLGAQPLSPLPEGEGQGKEQSAGPQVDSEGRVWLTIATTRPETIPADTAVAVSPKDSRYAHLIGKHVYRALPLDVPKEQRIIPIIADEHVDFEFGTGVLKVTPAHDKADFEIGQCHKLPLIDLLTPDAKMTAAAGSELAGLDRFAARKKAAEILETAGTLAKAEPYENNVGFSQRADVPIEPRLSEQWFLKYPAVPQSKACVEQEDGSSDLRIGTLEDAGDSSRIGVRRSDKMRFHPQRWAKVYDHWLTNIQDWCISRQLWWGHRIPVWSKQFNAGTPDFHELQAKFQSFEQSGVLIHMNIYGPHLKKEGEAVVLKPDPDINYLGRFDVAVEPSEETIVSFLEQHGFTQDPDVLDTWFSSWLWPFATMGWPEQTEMLNKFYPTTDLVTGPDIIFFWVARMIMAGYEFMGEMPFRNVYFTGIIRDKQGRKMSKTLGNSPDPLDLIAKYGADALRFGTMRSAPLGQDVLFDEKDVELGRNFCNKLWNACRFRQLVGQASSLPGSDAPPSEGKAGKMPAPLSSEIQGEIERTLLTTDDKWILLKLNQAIIEITEALNEYKFNEAAATLYRFFWSEHCDWYVEASKAVFFSSRRSNKADQTTPQNPPPHVGGNGDAHRANTVAVIDFVLSHTLRLFHPFLPFITEELWHGMGYAEDMPENQGGKTIMNAPWPKPFDDDFRGHYGLDDCYLEMAEARYDLVKQGRNLRNDAKIPGSKKVKFIFKPAQFMTPHDLEVLRLLLNAETLEVNAEYQPPKGTPTVRTGLGELCLPLEGLVDVQAEKARLTKEREKIESEISKVEQKLANPKFAQNAPPQVLAEHRQRLADWVAKLEHVKAALQALEG